MNSKYIEILSPAGTFESITAAVNSGCNAIYLGGKSFNARQYAQNFSDDDLKEIIKYCHLRTVKVFITVNTLYKNSEFNALIDFICKLYEFGADALIIQDIGLFSVLKKILPDLPLHASTQMTAHNLNTTLFLKNLGFERVVLSRELSLEEIEEICHNSNIEIECFVHGALCVSYSGRCLLSSANGGRSGNRGRCAQPCRMMYKLKKDNSIIKSGFLLSPKDILTAEIMDKLINAGITSFKIEGRMKSPEYVAKSTSIYRKYADMAISSKFAPQKKDIDELLQVFNRGGSSSKGYYDNWGGQNMLSLSPKSSGTKIGEVLKYDYKTKKCTIKTTCNLFCGDGIEIWTEKFPHTGTNISKNIPADSEFTIIIDDKIKKGNLVYKSFDKSLNDQLKKTYQKDTRKQKILVSVKCFSNSDFEIIMKSANGLTCSHSENIIEKAEKQPMSKDAILKQLCKTGNTPFEFIIENAEIGNDIYIPISKLNNFRRNACELLENNLSQSRKNITLNVDFPKRIPSQKTDISVSVFTQEQFDIAIKNNVSRIYVRFSEENVKNIDYYVKSAHNINSEIFFALPSIMRKNYLNTFNNLFQITENSQIDGYLIKNYDFPKTNKKIALDYSFNVLNSFSLDFLKKYAQTVAVSPELSFKEMSEICDESSEILIYGRLTVMTTHQCPVGIHYANKQCGVFCKSKNHKEKFSLVDRTSAEFPILTDCETCTAFILNSNPTCMLNKINELKNISPRFLRLDFTTETAELTEAVISLHKSAFIDKIQLNKEMINNFIKENNFTNGYFSRGVL